MHVVEALYGYLIEPTWPAGGEVGHFVTHDVSHHCASVASVPQLVTVTYLAERFLHVFLRASFADFNSEASRKRAYGQSDSG
jgi:hypothetical protein